MMRASLMLMALTAGALFGASQARAYVDYSYSPAGRVTTALYNNGTCTTFVYDASGNRTAQTTAATPSPPPQWGTAKWGCFKWTP